MTHSHISLAESGLKFPTDQDLEIFWYTLARISQLSIEARSMQESGGWNGNGKGTVITEIVDDTTLCTTENGFWNYPPGKRIEFSNIYRWTRDQPGNRVVLEHLRHGKNHPVILFDLVYNKPGSLRIASPFDCNRDRYQVRIAYTDQTVTMRWKISGPRKNERITCNYYY